MTPKEIPFGESFQNRNKFIITVQEPTLRESYKAWDSWDGGTKTVTPEKHDLFALSKVRVANEGSAEGSVPLPDSFFVRVDGTGYEIAVNPLMRKPEFRGELEGLQLFDTGGIPAGSAREGYVIFEVPSAARDGIEVGWSSRYSRDQVIYWV